MISGEAPRVVFISEDCSIRHDSQNIIITDPEGKEHKFPRGSYVFSDRAKLDANKW